MIGDDDVYKILYVFFYSFVVKIYQFWKKIINFHHFKIKQKDIKSSYISSD